MARAPRVSVCIPTYNQTDYLKASVESLLVQKFEDYEVIVTDDSETAVVENLLARYDFGGRLRYQRNSSRRGSPGNWNAAVLKARGEYIKLLHHDDWFPDDRALGDFVALMDGNESAAFGFSATSVLRANGTFFRTHRATPGQLKALTTFPESLYFGNVIGAPSATIYRSGIGISYDERLKWLVDVEFYIRVLRRDRSFAFSRRELICTPTGAHQVTQYCANDPAIDLGEHLLLLEELYPSLKNNPQLVTYWRNRLARHRIWTRNALDSVCHVPAQLNDFFGTVFAYPLWHWLRYGVPRRLRDVFRSY